MQSTSKPLASATDRYCAGISGRPLLSREQEAALARQIRNGAQEALNALVEANLTFVVKVAGEYRNLGMPFEDLLNEGNLGLIEAARRFDSERGTRFVTCAVWWIRKSILRALNENNGLVRVPATQQRRVRELREVEKLLARDLGRKPRRDELSARLSASPTKVDRLRQTGLREFSLDDRTSADGEVRFVDLLADRHKTDPEAELLRREARILVEKAIEELSEQERTVISYRFGLKGERPLVLRDVGAILGVSREPVRQVESQAIKRLKRILSRARSAPRPRQRRPHPGTETRKQSRFLN